MTIDFTGVESTGLVVPEDDYQVKVIEVEEEEGKKGAYWNWTLEIADGKFKGKKLYYITSLAPQSLWNLRSTLEALGMEIPDSPVDIDLDELIDMEMGVSVEHEKYKGKTKNRVVDVFNLEESGEEEESEDEEAEDEEEDEEEDLDNMSLEELIEYAEENEIKLKEKDKLNKKKAKAAILRSMGNDE